MDEKLKKLIAGMDAGEKLELIQGMTEDFHKLIGEIMALPLSSGGDERQCPEYLLLPDRGPHQLWVN